MASRFENGLHYRRDATLREDHSQLRIGHAPEPLAVINTTTLGLLARRADDPFDSSHAAGYQTCQCDDDLRWDRQSDGFWPGAGTGTQSILVSSRGMTPAYCSPEQAAGQPLSRKTDIWSWAVSVLEMFTGKVTWMSGIMAGAALADYQRQGEGQHALPRMPADLASLLDRCFQLQPVARPATMAEVATALLKIYEREVGHPYPREVPQWAEASARAAYISPAC